MTNNELFFLAHADTRFTFAESEQRETRTYTYKFVTSVPESSTVIYRLINNGILFIVYTDADHVRIYSLLQET